MPFYAALKNDAGQITKTSAAMMTGMVKLAYKAMSSFNLEPVISLCGAFPRQAKVIRDIKKIFDPNWLCATKKFIWTEEEVKPYGEIVKDYTAIGRKRAGLPV